jgi:Zn-dependent M16 (insulinase) family peptidase
MKKDALKLALATFLNSFSLTKDFPDRTIFEIAFKNIQDYTNVESFR